MFFSDPNIEVFTVSNKVFVVSFFRNIVLLSFSSAKALNFAALFWYIFPACNQFDIFSSFCAEESIYHTKKQGLLFFLFAPIMRKNARSSAAFFTFNFQYLAFIFIFFASASKGAFYEYRAL